MTALLAHTEGQKPCIPAHLPRPAPSNRPLRDRLASCIAALGAYLNSASGPDPTLADERPHAQRHRPDPRPGAQRETRPVSALRQLAPARQRGSARAAKPPREGRSIHRNRDATRVAEGVDHATFTTVVVGAGQCGLAMSRELGRRSVDHVVLEKGRVGNSWHAERWDSLRLLTPNWMSGPAGHPYPSVRVLCVPRTTGRVLRRTRTAACARSSGSSTRTSPRAPARLPPSACAGFRGRPGMSARAPVAAGRWSATPPSSRTRRPRTASPMRSWTRTIWPVCSAAYGGLERYRHERHAHGVDLFETTQNIASFDWDFEELKTLHATLNDCLKREQAALGTSAPDGPAEAPAVNAAARPTHEWWWPQPRRGRWSSAMRSAPSADIARPGVCTRRVTPRNQTSSRQVGE